MTAGSVSSTDEADTAGKAERQAQSSDDQVTIIFPGRRQPKVTGVKKTQSNTTPSVVSGTSDSELEPLIDRTAKLALISKKTLRLQRRADKKQAIRKAHSHGIQSFQDLPPELLLAVLGYLLPSDVSKLLILNMSMRNFILENESTVAEEIIRRRYWILRQCFPLPVSLVYVPVPAQQPLLSQGWQDRLRIHKNPYQHIKPMNPSEVCTCMSCVLAWNNLCIILDLAHWQTNLEHREPIPIIARGTNPEWNVELLQRNADTVMKAMKSPLTYARILQIHLDTTTRTIIRSGKWRKKGEKISTLRPRLYHLTDREAASGTDVYLERSGPPSYQPIFTRDNYYSVEAFVPNRKWDKDEQLWKYYSKWPKPHENDLEWLSARYMPRTST
ncbi:uncharacterized protein A1O9_08846 [Exophiala aquamarina CBS 119918]|uniref:F-box domain-containing protein n=1 Tax=Exophiala aquamarina CBS 119918 TaxID=1182545 RepID=A0A072P646_9EURO|nr:uncharacterized protein A1O9_08846 [Exophiala aquamarina CBS 119918]KEF55192.1 hypothetical protein A1O9_08846 [Exophiala aquamarina CBS 119918]